VSRVLNKRPGVKPHTREAVLKAMVALNYRPDAAARELSLGQGHVIGLNVSPGSRRLVPFFALFLEHLEAQLRASGLRYHEIPNGANGMPEWLPDGVVLFGVHDDDPRVPYLQDRDVPLVLVGRGNGVRWVAPDDEDGGYQATAHLVRLGHRRIAHVYGDLHSQASHHRYAGYLRALSEAGIAPDDALLRDGELTSLGAYRAVRKMIESKSTDFTAMFAASDEMAVGAIAALEDCGLRVPADVSVVGYDDLPEIGEQLSTIHQDIGMLAATVVQLITEALAGKPVRHVVLPVHLVARSTTSRIRDPSG
jgi:LacI family transcriptional regulator